MLYEVITPNKGKQVHEWKVHEMKYDMVPISPEDRETVIDIFNHYIENSFAAYPESYNFV